MARVDLPTTIHKRSIVLDGLKTSVSLEDEFWTSLREIAANQGVPLGQMLNEVHQTRLSSNFSSALRLFVLQHFMQSANSNASR
jgi:predicted DNA-binding ribbon-helix-helix protein